MGKSFLSRKRLHSSPSRNRQGIESRPRSDGIGRDRRRPVEFPIPLRSHIADASRSELMKPG